jgi:hypothetical protein
MRFLVRQVVVFHDHGQIALADPLHHHRRRNPLVRTIGDEEMTEGVQLAFLDSGLLQDLPQRLQSFAFGDLPAPVRVLLLDDPATEMR